MRPWLLVAVATACGTKSEAPEKSSQRVAEPPPVAVVIDASPPDAPERFVVTRTTDTKGMGPLTRIEVSLRGAPCPKIEFFQTISNSVRLARCEDRPLADQIELLRDLVTHLRGIVGPELDTAGLAGWGDFYSYPEYAKRLVQYATRVPYDPKQGYHAYIVAASEAEDMAPELTVIFQRPMKISSVEKCWASRPTSGDPGGEWLRVNGFEGNRSYPLGCSMAFWKPR